MAKNIEEAKIRVILLDADLVKDLKDAGWRSLLFKMIASQIRSKKILSMLYVVIDDNDKWKSDYIDTLLGERVERKLSDEADWLHFLCCDNFFILYLCHVIPLLSICYGKFTEIQHNTIYLKKKNK